MALAAKKASKKLLFVYERGGINFDSRVDNGGSYPFVDGRETKEENEKKVESMEHDEGTPLIVKQDVMNESKSSSLVKSPPPQQVPASASTTMTAGETTETKKWILPNIMFIGTQKSGSTALADWIFHHEEICTRTAKEIHFFNNVHKEGLEGLQKYSDKFHYARFIFS